MREGMMTAQSSFNGHLMPGVLVGEAILSVLFTCGMGRAQPVLPKYGEGFRSSFRILDRNGVAWGQMATSFLQQPEGGYKAMSVCKSGNDYLITWEALPDDPMSHWMAPDVSGTSYIEFHLKGRTYPFITEYSRERVLLLPERKLQDADAYQFILDQTYKDGGQLFLNFILCSELEEARTGEEKGPDAGASGEENEEKGIDRREGIKKLCTQSYKLVEADIPCADLEGSVGLSCKEIEDRIFCDELGDHYMKAFQQGKFKEYFGLIEENFDRCRKDTLFFNFNMGFLLLSKSGRWYRDVLEEYMSKQKIDPMAYVKPKEPYADICRPLAAYHFVKGNSKG
jgi:hypothetical protein